MGGINDWFVSLNKGETRMRGSTATAVPSRPGEASSAPACEAQAPTAVRPAVADPDRSLNIGSLTLHATRGVAAGQRVDFRDGDAVEIAWNRLFERARGGREFQRR